MNPRLNCVFRREHVHFIERWLGIGYEPRRLASGRSRARQPTSGRIMQKRFLFLIVVLTAVLSAALTSYAATFTTDTLISFDNTNFDGLDIIVTNCTVTIDGNHTFANVRVLAGGVLTHSFSPTGMDDSFTLSTGLRLAVTNNFEIEAGGAVNATGRGFGGGFGLGAGGNRSTNSPYFFYAGGGGGFGGYGGASSTLAPGGIAYGSVLVPTDIALAPNDKGSGGGGSPDPGGAGGGAIQLVVDGILRVDGQIVADGAPGTNPHSGGGAGGAIYLSAPILTGAGIISANGGAGEPSDGGGGGGGRIALGYITKTFTGTIVARGGGGAMYGGAGTIYKQGRDLNPQILADNGGWRGSNTLLSISGAYDVTISGNAVANFSSSSTVANLLIRSNGVLTHLASQTNLALTVTGDAIIEPGSGMVADAIGSPGGQGIGHGTSAFVAGSGAGYGGYGGGGISNAIGGIAYGSIFQPTNVGSGGGTGSGTQSYKVGGSGGGAIRLVVNGTLAVGGIISADGGAGVGQGSGGGSGGSIWLTVGKLSGSGSIRAHGGSGEVPFGGGGGGGGGGRVAIYYGTNEFGGPISAYGAPGARAGGAGTIYKIAAFPAVGQLIIDNGGIVGTNTSANVTGLFDLAIIGGAMVDSPPQSVRNLLIGSNSWVFSSVGRLINITASGNAVIEAGGGFLLDGYGSAGGTGAGAGRTASSPALGYTGGGGGYGGYGGTGAGGAAGGNYYGTFSSPGELGSGGGPGNPGPALGGAGGGALRLTVNGTLTLDGAITANGLPGLGQWSGGGSGGSVWLTLGKLSGTGLIAANGGAGDPPYGGGGGGGRLAIQYGTNDFAGVISARGGAGANYGGAGTLYSRANNSFFYKVVVDNGGASGTFTPIPFNLENNDLTVTGGGRVFLFAASQSMRSLFIGTNSFLSFTSSIVARSLVLSSNATIEAGGGIILDGLGNSQTGLGSFGTGSGGGYGGYGGNSVTNRGGGLAYGSATSPVLLGSAGGSGISSGVAGAGGGAFHLTVNGTLTLDGRISAEGLNAPPGNGSGGGSGGSLWLTVGRLLGTGVISVNGGAGDPPFGGGGGGGRLEIDYNTNLFAGTVSARGGPGANYGGAGTIFYSPMDKTSYLILADNGGVRSTNTTLSYSGSPFDLTITGAASVVVGGQPTVRNLFIYSNSWLTATSASFSPLPLTLTVQSNATIQRNAGINFDGLGYGRGMGLGPGGALNLTGGGGGHAGYGGASVSNAPGGNAYGAITSPSNAGSGGGSTLFDQNYLPGAGGGILRLAVAGTLQLDGRISADGNSTSATGSGGGAGGSLWISARTLTGSGAISANGGAGIPQRGGGGGGGRVALYYSTNLFTGPISALGGPGYNYGGAGTIFMQASNRGPAQIIVDNGGVSGTNTLISVSDSFVDLIVSNGASAAASSAIVRNLLITSNAWLTSPYSPTGPALLLNLTAQNATIQSGGGIILDGRGFPPGQGQGAGTSLPLGYVIAGSGGGHAGYGGKSASGAAGGNAYGVVSAPATSGSGGGPGTGSSTNNLGGSGGGALRLIVTSNLTLNGTISADGVAGRGQWSGGGSGGSLWLTVGTLTGGGLLSASGGAGDLPYGSGGGGGRIALFYSANDFTGRMATRGGTGYNYGGAGTLYLNANTSQGGQVAQVIVDNGGARGTNTPLTFTGSIDLAVSGGAIVNPVGSPTGSTRFRNLVLSSNGWLSHLPGDAAGLQFTVTGDATIQAGGGLIADGTGRKSTQGPGTGTATNNSTYGSTFGGGGYGGYGGSSIANARGGTVYGSLSQPHDLGSGGGDVVEGASSGPGGGLVQVTVNGSLTVNGRISADGGNAPSQGGGGGSGGSILLSVGRLSGSGLISANGGAGDQNQGGGGGGGRIAVYPKTNNSSGLISAHGGLGYVPGGAGTIFLKLSNNVPQLLVDNAGLVGTNTPLSSESQPLDLSVRGGAIVNPSVPALILSNLVVESGGSLTHLSTQTNLDLTILGNALIASGSSISVNAKGYSGSGTNGGPGAGQMPAGASGSGAGYGGPGGASASGTPAGSVYGSAAQPLDRGSRGGLVTPGPFPNFCQGGGALWMKVAGTFTIDGKITANGNDALYDRAGGGSGGSIWLAARNFNGSGFITANGGAGEPFEGGGGGGGRVAIYSRTNNFPGPIVAFGGSGASFGTAGTVIVTNLPPPIVIAQSPIGLVSYAVDYVDLTFSSPLNLNTIAATDFSVETPNGPLAQNLLGVSPASLTTVRVLFPAQDAIGYYEVQAGPQIEDFYGLPMSTSYIGSFVIWPPTISGRVTDTNGVGIPFVTIRPSSNLVATVTDANGAYALDVPPNWTGNISASRGSALFVPSSRAYTQVGMDLTNQNFTLLPPAALVMTSQQQGSFLAMNWYGLKEVSYQPLYSTNLVYWLPYGSPFTPASNGPIVLLVPITNTPNQFFRFEATY